MADQDVNIIGVDLDNSSMWATQKTMEDVLKAVENIADLTEKQKRDLTNGVNQMVKTGKANADTLKGAGGKGGGGNIFGDTTKGLAKFGGTVEDLTENVDDLAAGPMKEFGKGITGLTKRMGAIGGVGGLLMNQVGKAISTIKETVNAMRDLNSVGITIKGDFMGFQESLKESGTTISELSNIASKYARTVGNVGLESIVDMAKAAEKSGFAFSNYGLRLAEGAEFQAEMLESQRLGGIFRVRDQQEQSLVLQDNIKRLTAYSKILNVSREDMLAQQMELKGRADVQRRFNSFSDEQREAANKSFNQFSDIMASLGPEAKGLTDMMTTIIADPAAVNSEAFTQLASASPELAAAIMDLRSKIESGEEISQADIIDRMLGPLDAASKSGKLEMLSMNDGIGETVNMLGGPVLNSMRNYESRMAELTKDGKTTEEAIAALAEKTNESVKKATEAQTELDKFAATIKEARVKIFNNALGEEASSMFDAAIAGIKLARGKAEEMGNFDYRGSLMGLYQSMVDTFSNFFTWMDEKWTGFKQTMSDLWTGITELINNIIAIPGMIWNAVADALNNTFGLSIEKVDMTKVSAAPSTPSLGQVDKAVSIRESRQSLLDQAKAEGASPAQIEWMQKSVNQQDEIIAELRKLRSSGANGWGE